MQYRPVTFSIFSVLFAIFLFLTYRVMTFGVLPMDTAIDDAINFPRHHSLFETAAVITWLGSGKFLVPAVILMALIFLFINGRKSYAWKVVLVSLSGYGLVYLVKHLVKRERPSFAGDDASVFSYPSGHTFTGMMFFGLLSYFAIRYMHGPARWLVISIAFILAFSVGFSRIILEVHYASDILASWLLGTMWFMLAGWFLRMQWRRG